MSIFMLAKVSEGSPACITHLLNKYKNVDGCDNRLGGSQIGEPKRVLKKDKNQEKI